ncbi:MAG: M20/M25/M40 family metallo-hydrolase [Clostridia bacterium]|nr:M20/M25/M40 family metallo-hydrolase [Clostridia bacterium]
MKYTHQQTVDVFLEMVKVDSPSFSEKNMVDYLVDKINSYGWDAQIERLPVLVKRFDEETKIRLANDKDVCDTEQLVVIIPATVETKDPIYFCAHIDTVSPGKGVKPVIKGDMIYSDGTTVLGGDDKSGVAGLVVAVDEVIKKKIPHGKIVLIFTALEEKGHMGAHQIDINKYGVRYGYVFDTSGNVGKIMRRGQHGQSIEVTITVDDIPNHTYSATVPNALGHACDLIAKIDKKLFNANDMTFTQVLSLKTENQPGYMVPYKAVFKILTRSFIKKDQQKRAAKIVKLLDNFKAKNAKLEYKISPKQTIGYDHADTDDGRLMMSKAESVIKEMGLAPEYITMGLGGHDASSFMMRGVPSIVLSCGMQEIHTTKEYIDIQDLHDCTELVIRLIEKA